MYGLVNRAIQELITERHGAEKWEEIRRAAGIDTEVFISSETYDDSITYRLVGTASEVLKAPPEEILKQFGEHWVLKTAKESYGFLLKASGRGLPEFLKNLPNFHTRVMLMFPNLKPPSFRVTDATEDSLHLHYYSPRRGLAPFVLGLLSGLGKMYNTEVQTEILTSREGGSDHETFLVRWSAPAQA